MGDQNFLNVVFLIYVLAPNLPGYFLRLAVRKDLRRVGDDFSKSKIQYYRLRFFVLSLQHVINTELKWCCINRNKFVEREDFTTRNISTLKKSTHFNKSDLQKKKSYWLIKAGHKIKENHPNVVRAVLRQMLLSHTVHLWQVIRHKI